MSTPTTIAKILKCDTATAQKIADTMYNWIMPDWSEQSTASLRADLELAAELEGVEIVKSKAAKYKQLKMTLQKGIELGKMAKAKCLGVKAKNGKVQIISWTYDAKGASTITPHSGWLTYEEAKSFLA